MRSSKFLFLFLLLSFSNCASFQNYLSNRALDFKDILTLGGEVNIYGGSFWLWCFGGGAQIGQFGDGYGMRNGYVGYYRTGGREKLGDLKMGNSFFLMNSQEHLPEAYHTKRSMNKVYTHANFLFLLPANLQGRRGNPPTYRLPMLCKAPLTIEASYGFGIGGRIGFNIAEFFDFLLGFTTFDIMEDDEPVKLETETEGEEE